MTASKHLSSQPAQARRRPRAAANPRAARSGARFKRKVQLAPNAAAGALGAPVEEPGRRNVIRRELRRLDKAWEGERERHMIPMSRSSKLNLPDWRVGITWPIITLFFVYVFVADVPIMEGRTNTPAPDGKMWMGVLLLFHLYTGITYYGKSIDYHQALRAYQRRRAELLAGDLERSEDWQGMAGADWIPGQPSAER